MKVTFEKSIYQDEKYVEGLELDIRDDEVYVQIGYGYISLNKDELTRALKAIGG